MTGSASKLLQTGPVDP